MQVDEPINSYDPIADEPVMGLQEVLGYRIIEWQSGVCRLRLDVDHRHLNRSGLIHGGIHCTLIDAACGISGTYCPVPGNVRRCVTLSLTTHFIGVSSSKTLFITGRIAGGGNAVFFAEAEVRDGRDKLLANGSGSFKYHRASRTSQGEPR